MDILLDQAKASQFVNISSKDRRDKWLKRHANVILDSSD
jgi:hypothetical protein